MNANAHGGCSVGVFGRDSVLSVRKLGDTGLERPTLTADPANNLRDAALEGGAKSGAVTSKAASSDPDLTMIVSRWADLPQHVKATIKTIIDAASQTAKGDHP